MPWFETFAVFLVSHAAGDFLLQTDWQARHKHGGLSADPRARRALLAHGALYALAFVPALVWLAGGIGAWAVAVGLLIVVPHVGQDDGRLLHRYARSVKGMEPAAQPGVLVLVDQSFHLLALFATALIAAA